MISEAAENGVDEVFNQAVTTGRVDVKSAALGMIPGLNLVSVGGGGGGCKTPRRGAPAGRTHSFEASTPVLMADGSQRPIEDVNVGDKVRATDPKTGESKAEPVTVLHRNVDHEFSDVTVRDPDGKSSTLKTTQSHPFWNATEKEWTDAKDLKRGTKLKVAGKGKVVVTSVRNHQCTKEMRDLTGRHHPHVLCARRHHPRTRTQLRSGVSSRRP